MDEVFGIGELINEDIRENKRSAYTAKDLRGLKVEHSMVRAKFVFLRFKDRVVIVKVLAESVMYIEMSGLEIKYL